MKERIKVISKEDLLRRDTTYQNFEELLVNLVSKTLGYHSKFDTGFGWLLNVSRLKEHEIISCNMFHEIHKWFEKDFILGQEILVEEWKKYDGEELDIKVNLLSLVDVISKPN